MAYIHSENDFLTLIDDYFPSTHPSIILGRGDDCAEIACPERMAVSTDLFVEDIHFRRSYFTPYEIGYKALAINLSDLAAAGAVPLGFSVGLTCPVPFPKDDARQLLAGMSHIAKQHGITITGGDLSRGEKLSFCVTVWGGPVTPGTPFLRRHPVQPGDILFYCGTIGLARVGLSTLETQGRAALETYPVACSAHLTPTPLVQAGQIIAGIPGGPCHGMDISDGLARDLPRLLQQRGAILEIHPHSLHPEVLAYAHEQKLDPVLEAFSGGEDFGLLGACPPEHYDDLCIALHTSCPPVRLGIVTQEPGLILNGTSLRTTGFDHFTTK